MNWIGKYVAAWQSRIALGVVFALAIVNGLWPDHARAIDPPKLIACIVAGLAWLAAEFASAVTKASNHDIALFERINNVMDINALTFLLEHDFSHDFSSNRTDPVTTIAEWHGHNFMFNDQAIQRRWQALFDKIVALSHLYGHNLTNSPHNTEILTAWHIGFPRNAQPPQAQQEVAALNEAAPEVYQALDEFALYVRKRLDL